MNIPLTLLLIFAVSFSRQLQSQQIHDQREGLVVRADADGFHRMRSGMSSKWMPLVQGIEPGSMRELRYLNELLTISEAHILSLASGYL